MPLGREVRLGPSDIVLDGDPAPPPQKREEPPIFAPCLLWPNGLMDQDDTWDGNGPRCARRGPSSPPSPKKEAQPQFSAHFYCGQTAGCIRIPLVTEVGLCPGDIVLDGGTAAPPQKAARSPIFGPCLLWPNGRPSQLLLSSCTN